MRTVGPPDPPEPRWAPDPPAHRALAKLLAAARADPRVEEHWLAVLEIYTTLAYEKGRRRGRTEGRGAR